MKKIHLIASMVLIVTMSTAQKNTDNMLSDVNKNNMISAYQEDKYFLQSTDGGKTWLDAGMGLPADIQINCALAQNGELYVGTRNAGLYIRNSKTSHWQLQQIEGTTINDLITGVYAGSKGVYASFYDGGFYRKLADTNYWEPMHLQLADKSIRGVLETSNGTIFVSCLSGIYKSSNDGKTWSHVWSGGWSNGLTTDGKVFLVSTEKGLMRSTDDGEHWTCVLEDDRSVYSTTLIEGHFITIRIAGAYYSPPVDNRWLNWAYQGPVRVLVSSDGGLTWQGMREGLAKNQHMTKLERVGDYLFCSHEGGISRSADYGKTWELMFANNSGNNYFQINFVAAGSILFAIKMAGGC